MVKPSGFNAPKTDTVYPLGHLIGNFQSIKLFLFLKKKKKVPSNTFTDREIQEKEETTKR